MEGLLEFMVSEKVFFIAYKKWKKKTFEILRSWDAINKHTHAFAQNIHKNIYYWYSILAMSLFNI